MPNYTVLNTTCATLLTEGSPLAAALCPYMGVVDPATHIYSGGMIFNPGNWFLVLMGIPMIGGVYLKTQSPFLSVMVAILLFAGSANWVIRTGIGGLISIISIVTLAALLYYIFMKGE